MTKKKAVATKKRRKETRHKEKSSLKKLRRPKNANKKTKQKKGNRKRGKKLQVQIWHLQIQLTDQGATMQATNQVFVRDAGDMEQQALIEELLAGGERLASNQAALALKEASNAAGLEQLRIVVGVLKDFVDGELKERKDKADQIARDAADRARYEEEHADEIARDRAEQAKALADKETRRAAMSTSLERFKAALVGAEQEIAKLADKVAVASPTPK